MPETTDVAALPTSWALTLWDALPLYLSVELALAVAIVVLFRSALRQRVWSLAATYPVSGVAFLALFDIRLAALMSLIAGSGLLVRLVRRSNEQTPPAPGSPTSAIRTRFGSTIGVVAIASAAAAVNKIFLLPALDSASVAWYGVAVLVGLLTPVPPGAAAIPALPVASAADNTLVGGVALIASYARTPLFAFLVNSRVLVRVGRRTR